MDPDRSYPQDKFVADHVPFYIAAKSPMLFAVTRGHIDYNGGDDQLVFLGVSLGRIAESDLTWCVSDQNAACDLVSFSREVDQLGGFVDFDLLCQRMWNKTPDDQHRPSRRAAEVLVLDRMPLTLVSHVIAKTRVTLSKAEEALRTVGGTRQYRVERDFYYS
ncbi:DUF4433 domain-containing protein [Gandjariella thermophila]|uniref:DarT domain-containing protein n=1 Tax=Gandjariella thermophila TaxID=1931992 RepID=A0A4D4J8P9_9PSEU|nr:DUF4433 domain-containing protein [Gandjariella thermophila]GDY33041.1 hypothetical protein GTS_46740 [Gandjariella thermophila]